jgi:hypothetical protein
MSHIIIISRLQLFQTFTFSTNKDDPTKNKMHEYFKGIGSILFLKNGLKIFAEKTTKII